MQNGGWIKIHRKIEDWGGYLSEPFDKTHAWIDLILLANHTQTSFFVRGIEVVVERGELAWSEDNLGKRWKWSRSKVRRFLTWLNSIQQIRQQKSSIISKIIILKYDEYQKNDTTDDTTNVQQTIQQTNTYKNVKNDKNDKNVKKEEGGKGTSLRFVPPSLQEIQDYCLERKNQISPQGFFDFYESKGWMIGKNRMKDWKAAVRTWEQKDYGTAKGNKLQKIEIEKILSVEEL